MLEQSGFGTQVRIIASKTFPNGFTVTSFADDADPFDLPDMVVAETATGVNGDQASWARANAIKINISLMANTEDDKNMAVLLEANRPEAGKKIAYDEITITAIYPDGKQITLSKGCITNGMPGNSIASAGRLKSKTYGFSFQSIATAG